MSSYKITKYSFDKAKELGVTIKPSSNKLKKIDVYKDNKKIATIGDINYDDYPNYIIKKGLEYANERRKLYKIRHKKDKNLNGYYANKILW
jgi:hypothetical protein